MPIFFFTAYFVRIGGNTTNFVERMKTMVASLQFVKRAHLQTVWLVSLLCTIAVWFSISRIAEIFEEKKQQQQQKMMKMKRRSVGFVAVQIYIVFASPSMAMSI